jgi:hypothetical protein
MKKNQDKRVPLTLNCETIRELETDLLERVSGGISGPGAPGQGQPAPQWYPSNTAEWC